MGTVLLVVSLGPVLNFWQKNFSFQNNLSPLFFTTENSRGYCVRFWYFHIDMFHIEVLTFFRGINNQIIIKKVQNIAYVFSETFGANFFQSYCIVVKALHPFENFQWESINGSNGCLILPLFESFMIVMIRLILVICSLIKFSISVMLVVI